MRYCESSFVQPSKQTAKTYLLVWSFLFFSNQSNSIEMKIFQSTVEFLAIVGITPQSRSFNIRSLLALMAFAIIVILVCAFLFCEASNFKEYTESIYISSVSIAIFSTYSFVIWKKDNIFLFIDCWESIAVTSEYQSWKVRILWTKSFCVQNILGSQNPASKIIYVKIIEKVEKWSRFIHIVLLYVTVPSFVLPKYVVSFYLFYTTDLGNDAFELPLPVW